VDDPVEHARVRWPALRASETLRGPVQDKIRALAEGACDAERQDELVLACACAEQQPGALLAFEREYLVHVPRWVARLNPDAALLDELLQSLRERLFVGDDRRAARIGEYAGKGPLGAWLRVLAVRLTIDLRRRAQVRAAASVDRAPIAVAASSEAAYVKARYLADLQAAINGAARTLSAQQRALLRAHFVEGATFDELAAAHGINPATVWRRIAAARDAVVEAVRRALQESGRVLPADFDSILRTVHSQLDFSFSHSS
jgi:RNA polymerase sigma-70 factor (ECF subfamily)